MWMTAEQNKLSYRVIEHWRFDLRLHRAATRTFHRGEFPQQHAIDVHLAAVKRNQSGDGTEQCALAAAVRADHGKDFTRAEVEVDAAQHLASPVAGADGAGSQQCRRFGHSFSTSARNFSPASNAAGPGMLKAAAGKTTTRPARTAARCFLTGCPRIRARTSSRLAAP